VKHSEPIVGRRHPKEKPLVVVIGAQPEDRKEP